MAKAKTLDLTYLMEDRVHLTGFECSALRALRQLQTTFSYPWYRGPRIEFWQVSITNPAKVACVNCFWESAAVRAANPTLVVIDIRGKERG